jgi:hypothetical protein
MLLSLEAVAVAVATVVVVALGDTALMLLVSLPVVVFRLNRNSG